MMDCATSSPEEEEEGEKEEDEEVQEVVWSFTHIQKILKSLK